MYKKKRKKERKYTQEEKEKTKGINHLSAEEKEKLC
jgi:hypothetical protein